MKKRSIGFLFVVIGTTVIGAGISILVSFGQWMAAAAGLGFAIGAIKISADHALGESKGKNVAPGVWVKLTRSRPERAERWLYRLTKKERDRFLDDWAELEPFYLSRFGIDETRRRFTLGVCGCYWRALWKEIAKIAEVVGKFRTK